MGITTMTTANITIRFRLDMVAIKAVPGLAEDLVRAHAAGEKRTVRNLLKPFLRMERV